MKYEQLTTKDKEKLSEASKQTRKYYDDLCVKDTVFDTKRFYKLTIKNMFPAYVPGDVIIKWQRITSEMYDDEKI